MNCQPLTIEVMPWVIGTPMINQYYPLAMAIDQLALSSMNRD